MGLSAFTLKVHIIGKEISRKEGFKERAFLLRYNGL
jgi:hypothetical protein